ncbi:MAG: PadR family transcriptional regulator [Acidobacteriia bacterium]|nr:PadR family transcriptional regulator [Terriglobia bacterium]
MEVFVTPQDDRFEPSLPLTAAMFQVLLSLAGGEKHGYAILKDVNEQAAGEAKLGTGTLYGIIKRLLGEGMIIECVRRPARGDDDARRRYYQLTDWGRQVAAAEAERMEKLIAIARGKHLLKRLKPA